MIAEFDNLEQSEKDIMYGLPIYVSVLVAGADGNIDSNELEKAISLANNKTKKARKQLLNYYNIVNENFEDKIKMAIANLPSGVRERELTLIDNLAMSNVVFARLNKSFAIKLYSSLKDIALQVAEASGGVFGYMSVGYEESKVVDLKMIHDPSK
jgi:hypothetical protein